MPRTHKQDNAGDQSTPGRAADEIAFTPDDPSDWSGSADPGNVAAALDQLASTGGGTQYITGVFQIEFPTTAVDYVGKYIPAAATLARIFGITDTGTVGFNLVERAESSPDSGGSTLDSVSATSSGTTETSFSDSSVAANTWIAIDVTSVTGSPTLLTVGYVLTVD